MSEQDKAVPYGTVKSMILQAEPYCTPRGVLHMYSSPYCTSTARVLYRYCTVLSASFRRSGCALAATLVRPWPVLGLLA